MTQDMRSLPTQSIRILQRTII